MAVKTITIDMEAYETLARRKRPGQSFSEVIKERFGSSKSASGLLEALKNIKLGNRPLAAVERVVRDRKTHPAKVPTL